MAHAARAKTMKAVIYQGIFLSGISGISSILMYWSKLQPLRYVDLIFTLYQGRTAA
jgi:hypothetical protein